MAVGVKKCNNGMLQFDQVETANIIIVCMIESLRELNQEFKKSIRKKQIDQLFTKRRLQLREEAQSQTTPTYSMQEFTDICRHVEQGLTSLQLDQLKLLAKLSTHEDIVREMNTAKFKEVLNSYLQEKHLNSMGQYYSTFILANLFCLNSDEVGMVSGDFLENLYFTAINCTPKIQQNCLEVFFSFLHDIRVIQLENLLENSSSFNPINFMVQLLKSNPTESIYLEVFRALFLVIKRLQHPKVKSFMKFFRFLDLVIRNSTCLPLMYLACTCLQNLMACLPEEPDLFSRETMRVVLGRILAIKAEEQKQYLVSIGLKIVESCLSYNKSESESVRCVIDFLLKIPSKLDTHSLKVKSFKMIYFIMQEKENMGILLNEYLPLVEHLLTAVESTTDRQVLSEGSNCLCMLLWSQEAGVEMYRSRIEANLEKVMSSVELDQKLAFFIENTLCFSKKE